MAIWGIIIGGWAFIRVWVFNRIFTVHYFFNVETKLTFQTTTTAPGCNTVVVGLEPLVPSAGALPLLTKCMNLCLSGKENICSSALQNLWCRKLVGWMIDIKFYRKT